MSLQYPVTCCGAQSVWELHAELASKNVHQTVETLTWSWPPSTNCTGWHSIWSPGQTQVHILDSRTSSHHYHPEYGDRGSFWKVRTFLRFDTAVCLRRFHWILWLQKLQELIPSSWLNPDLPSGIFRFPHQNPVWISLLHHTFPLAHPFHNLWFDTLILLGETYKSCSTSICNFLQSLFTSYQISSSTHFNSLSQFYFLPMIPIATAVVY